MITRYGTRSWGFQIQTQDFIGETDQFLVMANNRKTKKSSEHEKWHETKEQAIEHMRNVLLGKIKAAEEKVVYAESQLAEFNKTYPL